MYKTVVFDFDGTLADTLGFTYEAANRIALEKGRPLLDDVQSLRNLSLREFMSRFKVNLFELVGYVSRVQKEMGSRIHSIDSFPKMKETLQALKEKNVRIGVISSNKESNVRAFLDHHGFSVDFVHGGASLFGKHNKIRSVLRKHKLSNIDTLYVGDEIRDIVACKRINLPVAAVSWGYNSASSLKAKTPTHFFSCPSRLINLVN